jgi:excisionase family DNA binding protein
MTETMKAGQAAEFLGLSEWSVYDLVRRRIIPHVRVSRRVLFRRETLLRWMAEQEAASVGEQAPEPGGIRRLK